MAIEYAGLTDVGMRRDHNEDSYCINPESSLFIVCDGMGGHAAGDVASTLAIESLTSALQKSTPETATDAGSRLRAAVSTANAAILEAAAAGRSGMGTTIVAVLFDEPEKDQLVRQIAADPRRLVSAGTLLEVSLVVESRRGESAGRELDLLLHRLSATVVPFDESQATLARSAWQRYGKGNHHAALNFGDCFAYALSRVSGEPLLFKGADFSLTDVAVASA